jgi:RNA polymerase sigma-54 factor
MLQSLELIQLSLLDLRERIDTELLENPALEIDEKKQKKEQDDQNLDNLENAFSDEVSFFEDSSSAEISSGVSPNSSKIDLKRQFIEGAISYKQTLRDHLIWQLHVQNLTDKQKQVGETIISLIDNDGFFKDDLTEVFSEEDDQVIATDILEVIQMFDPPGIAQSGVRDTLLFQIESMPVDNYNHNAHMIIQEHFDLMINRKDNQIAKKMQISISEVRDAFSYLSQLNPYPGREFASDETRYILPDAYVYRQEDELVVELNNEVLPSLTISKYLKNLSKNKKESKRDKNSNKYVNNKITQAKRFIYIIEHRNESLAKLVLAMIKFQRDFFYKGPKHIHPLTMKDVAEEIGLSESTISRLANSKYIQTEWGIHEIKYFFSNSIATQGGSGDKSAESVREIIKEVLQEEKGKKISDQKIADILQNRGIKIARRTVAKYRKMLDILPSHQRNIQ